MPLSKNSSYIECTSNAPMHVMHMDIFPADIDDCIMNRILCSFLTITWRVKRPLEKTLIYAVAFDILVNFHQPHILLIIADTVCPTMIYIFMTCRGLSHTPRNHEKEDDVTTSRTIVSRRSFFSTYFFFLGNSELFFARLCSNIINFV